MWVVGSQSTLQPVENVYFLCDCNRYLGLRKLIKCVHITLTVNGIVFIYNLIKVISVLTI